MATFTNRLVMYIETSAGDTIEGAVSPLAFRDVEETINWLEGTHISDGNWMFDIPTGLSSGIKWAVQTSSGVFEEDENLNGAFGATDYGMFVANPGQINT